MTYYNFDVASDSGAQRRLEALIAALDKLDADVQVSALRQYLEYGLARMEKLEDAFYAYLAECAQLASENLQDIRLLDIERRLGNLEHPPEQPLGEILLAVALEFALQATVLAATEGLGSLLLAYMNHMALGKAMRGEFGNFVANSDKLGKEISALKSTLQGLQEEQEILARTRAALPDIYENMLIGKLPNTSVPLNKDVKLSLNSPPEAIDLRIKISARQSDISREAMMAKTLLTDKEARQVAEAIAAHEAILAGEHRTRKTAWDDFLNGAYGSVYALNPINSLVDKSNQWLKEANAQQGVNETFFLSSSVAGKFLAWIRGERLAVAELYASLRLAVRYTAEATVKESQFIRKLTGVIARVLPEMDRLHCVATAVRPVVISGFEAAYWREYLQSSGMLEVRQTTYVEYASDESELQSGQLHQGYVIGSLIDKKQYFNAPGTDHQYAALFYPGVLNLSDLQAEYLYKRFAKNYFAMEGNTANLPFEYQASHYAEIAAIPTHIFLGTVKNPLRDQRLQELRFMVIHYFLQVSPDSELDERLQIVLSAQHKTGVGQWTSSLNTGIVPELEANLSKESISTAANVIESLLALSDEEQDQKLQLALLNLNTQLTDLNFDILNYTLAGGENTDEDDFSSQSFLLDMANNIEDEKQALVDTYNAILEDSRANQQMHAAILATYNDSVNKLLLWDPSEAEAKKWKWYGPERETQGN